MKSLDKVKRILVIWSLLLSTSTLAQNPWDPIPRPEGWWMDRHNQFVENSRLNASNIEVVFLGSSLVEYWSTTGEPIWTSKYAPLGAVNYGIGGDKIEHCLWRAMNGELDGLSPKLVVLYCGSNNIPVTPDPLDIVRGVTTTIEAIRTRLPETNILYVTHHPRADVMPVNATLEKIITSNREVIRLHNGEDNLLIHDMFYDLLVAWGEINMDYYTDDKLHLNLPGYGLWDRVWNHTFFQGLN